MHWDEIVFRPHKLARKTDPDTSHAAAKSIKTTRNKQHEEIIRVMEDADAPLTAENIGDILLYPIWRRMAELEGDGLIVRTNIKRKNRSGRQAYCYEIKSNISG